jgi:UDP-N-acetylglucosamine/UDP-N-acetylgalactosamine diphosphorylase
VNRDEEFSPLKNAEGAKTDSPNSCRADVDKLHRRYITAAGGHVVGDGLVEVSPLLTYAGEGLEELVKGKTFQAPLVLK